MQDPTYKRLHEVSRKRDREQLEIGISGTAMKLKYGALYDEAVLKGDIWEEEGGLWYERSEIRSKRKSEVNSGIIEKATSNLDHTESLALEMEMTAEVETWAKVDFKKMIADRASSGAKGAGSSTDHSRIYMKKQTMIFCFSLCDKVFQIVVPQGIKKRLF